MNSLPDKLTDNEVENLVATGKAYYESFCNKPKFFAVINGDLYRKYHSYHILKRGYEEYKSEINNRLKNGR